MKVLLLAGSWSPEADISLKGAKEIQNAMEENGHSVTLCNPLYEFDNIISLAHKHDVAFINMHGSPGEDGLIQSLLSVARCPFQGGDAQSSFLALHKASAKQIYKNAGINTAEWHFLAVRPSREWKPNFDFPIFMKSNTGGSSINLTKVNSLDQMHKELETFFALGHQVLLEPNIEGVEVSCGVLEVNGVLQAMPPVMIKPKEGTYFDFEMKYSENGAEEICPAPIEKKLYTQVQELAVKAHNALGLKNYSRTDFIISTKGDIFCLETNTIPGMTKASLLPKEAAAMGYSFSELLEILLQNAIRQH